jgi:hypothetical protein
VDRTGGVPSRGTLGAESEQSASRSSIPPVHGGGWMRDLTGSGQLTQDAFVACAMTPSSDRILACMGIHAFDVDASASRVVRGPTAPPNFRLECYRLASAKATMSAAAVALALLGGRDLRSGALRRAVPADAGLSRCLSESSHRDETVRGDSTFVQPGLRARPRARR